MKIIAIGDNVVDCYVHERTYYPGGNAVNVAVNAKRFGAKKSSYIGIFGNDEPARHIRECLSKEEVDYHLSRKVYATSGRPQVTIKGGDRVFLRSPKDTAQHILRLNLTNNEIEQISGYDVCHTSCYSNIEHELKRIAQVCEVSFDYSDDSSLDYIRSTIQYVDYAFFSGSNRTEEERDEILELTNEYNVKVVGITLGEHGTIVYHSKEKYFQKPLEIEVVDTMGAGDSFIAGFLVSYIEMHNIVEALRFANQCAAECCMVCGGFGYPHPFGEDTI